MIYPLGLAGFSLLNALSSRNDAPDRASRPFDNNRDGFVLAEGAGVLIIEELSHARNRGASILAEIAGYGATSDAYRLTDMDPEGTGARRAMEAALRKAGMGPEQVDHISAHGTSTRVNDVIETIAIKKVFGERAHEIPVSSIKSMLGHMIAAAGAIELIASVFAIRHNIIPPTINYEEKDPNCDLDYVPNNSLHKEVNTVLSNSFGFGGQNICLVVKDYDE
jgi:3-oxoacyl-[acyl-carrier-protein] synthase II